MDGAMTEAHSQVGEKVEVDRTQPYRGLEDSCSCIRKCEG